MTKKIIFWLFAFLFFFVPLVLWPFTSEVFEFNKIVLVYALTTLIVSVWAVRSIQKRKFIFRRTILDKPLLIFLASQFISTILSIDPLTSWLGYYSRFNGGLLSTICYSLLYWAFVSNLNKKDAKNLINYSLLPGAALVSLYGVAEHFGIDKNIWVQDVQSRIFSTLGQPNWLAAWVVALMPLSWGLLIKSKIKSFSFWVNLGLSILFFWTLIFTKSRSGYLGVAAAFVVFWGFYLLKMRSKIKSLLRSFGLITLSFFLIILISGTEYTPSLANIINKSANKQISNVQTGDTALETGGTESGVIRQIVWKGAVDIWKAYPVFGTGVETFAFSYYKFRPPQHNLTSEWDFIYNKAHNEFLNMAANSGTVGLIAYLVLIFTSIYVFIKEFDFPFTNFQFPIKLKNSQIGKSLESGNWTMDIALLAGFISLSVTNFFGFSVVPTQLEFFLFPAFGVVLSTEYKVHNFEKTKVSGFQKILAFFVLCTMFYVLFAIGKYWLADTYYAKGTSYYSIQRPDLALNYLNKAVNFEPNQPLYYAGSHALSDSYASLALAEYHAKNATSSAELVGLALSNSQKAADLAPSNITLKRVRFGLFITLSAINPNYLLNARDTLIDAINYAPTDAKLYYNLGLVYARTGDPEKAISTLQKTVELKSNYADARLALAYLLIDKKDYADAKMQLEYILTKIDPVNSLAKQALESIK